MARASQYADQKLAVLSEISDRHGHHGRPPSVRELAAQFETGSATMHSWLRRLGEEGLVAWTPGRHRSLRCTPLATQLLSSQVEQSA